MGFLPPFFVMHVQPSSSRVVVKSESIHWLPTKAAHLVGKITDDKVERDPDSFTLLIASQISFTLLMPSQHFLSLNIEYVCYHHQFETFGHLNQNVFPKAVLFFFKKKQIYEQK